MVTQNRIVSIRKKGGRIVEIGVTDTYCTTVDKITVVDAINRINAGTDSFCVAETACVPVGEGAARHLRIDTFWSPVKVVHGASPEYLKTERDGCDYSNLENLPHH